MLPRLMPTTQTLLWAIALGFLLQLLLPDITSQWLALWPVGMFNEDINGDGSFESFGFMPWQLITYGFLHGDFGHLFFNALALWMFGSQLEQVWGPRRYLTFFLVCVAGAGIVQLTVAFLSDGLYPTIGASGGVYGLLLGNAMLFPNQRVMLLIPPIPMKMRTLVIAFGALELFFGIFMTRSGVAHFAHLGGMLFGWLLIQYWRGKPPFRKSKLRIMK